MVQRVCREIVLPRVVRPIIRPQAAVTKTLRATMRQQTIKPRDNSRRTAIVSPKRHTIRQHIPARIKKPTVKVITRDPPEASIRRIHELHNSCVGRMLVIIANGPSVLEVDTTKLLGNPRIDLMSINKPDMRIWPTKYWLFCDTSQLKRHRELWSNYNGCILNSTMISESRPGTVQIKNIPGKGFSLDLTKGFHIGRSSVYAAMQVALWLGYDKIYIFGIDMGSVSVNGQDMLHFYGVNPDVSPDNRAKRFKDEAKYYEDAVNKLPEEIRKRFYFCSSYNKFEFLDAFNRLGHREAIELIIAQE